MRLRTVSFICPALLVLSFGFAAAQSALPLDGIWQGTVVEKRARGSREVRQSRGLPVVVRITASDDGRYVGQWLNGSARRIADIGEVAIDGDAVRIGVPSSHGVWEGKLSSDGLTLAGEWRQGGETTPLVLRRTGDADELVRFDSFDQRTATPR
jgi:hypothetical protein